MENTWLATIADGKTTARTTAKLHWGEGKKTTKTQPEPAFGWVLIGWVLGRSLRFPLPAREA